MCLLFVARDEPAKALLQSVLGQAAWREKDD